MFPMDLASMMYTSSSLLYSFRVEVNFGFLLGRYTALFGDADGKALASADAGPLDEAYVGGGS